MQNISGNIANSQTIAFKGINTSFEDLDPGRRRAAQANRRRRHRHLASQPTPSRARSRPPRSGPTWPSTATAISSCRSPTGFNGNCADVRRRRQLHPARRLPAQRQRLSGQRRRLLSRRHSDRSDHRQSDRQRCRAAAIPEQLPAGERRRPRSTTASTFRPYPSTAAFNSQRAEFRTAQSRGFHRSRSDSRRDRHGHRNRRVDLRQRVGRWRNGDDSTTRPARRPTLQLQMGQDRQRRQRRHRHLGSVLSDRLDRDRRTVAGKTPAPISPSTRSASSIRRVTNLPLDRRHHQRRRARQSHADHADRQHHAIRQHQRHTPRSTTCSRTATPPASCRQSRSATTARITGTFSNGQNVALAEVPLVHFNSAEQSQSARRRRLPGNGRLRARRLPAHPARSSGNRSKAPTPISRPSSPS